MRFKFKNSLIFFLGIIPSIFIACASPQDTKLAKDIIESLDGEPVVPRNANKLYLKLSSVVTEKDLAGLLLPRLRETISLDGRLGLVDNAYFSDCRLDVIVTGFMIQDLKFDSMGRCVKKRMRITAGVALFDVARNKQVFSDPEIQAFREFSDEVPPIESFSHVIENVLSDLAKRISAKTLSGWYTQYMSDVEKGKAK
jgi:hypothetical protein